MNDPSSMHPLLQFHDAALLRQALTHRSYLAEHPDERVDNERLEFLGDALLTFLSGDYLYQRHPGMGEDEMTRRRAALVDEKQLARFALTVGLDRRMRLGKGAIRDRGYENTNLLSSTFEAVVGAYYLDHSREVETLRPLIEQLFDSVPAEELATRAIIDVKNQLQEWVHAHVGPQPPHYTTEKVGGMDHNPEFMAQVWVGDRLYGQGRGRSKKAAEKHAAIDALRQLGRQN